MLIGINLQANSLQTHVGNISAKAQVHYSQLLATYRQLCQHHVGYIPVFLNIQHFQGVEPPEHGCKTSRRDKRTIRQIQVFDATVM